MKYKQKRTFLILILSLCISGAFCCLPQDTQAKTCEESPKEEMAGWFKSYSGSIVPCGRKCDDPATSDSNEEATCTLCHMVIVASRIFNLLLAIIGMLGILMITISGVLYAMSGPAGSSGLHGLAISMLSKTIWGLFLFFTSWLLVTATLKAISARSEVLGNGKNWYEFTCDTTSAFSSGGGSSSSGEKQTSLTVTPPNVNLTANSKTTQLKVSYDGKDVTNDPSTSYAVKDGTGVTVSKTGLIQLQDTSSAGGTPTATVTIEVTHQSKSATVQVTVDLLSVTPESATLNKDNKSQQLTVTYAGKEVTTDPAITYTPADSSLVTVNNSGAIGMNPLYKASDEKKKETTVEVKYQSSAKTVKVAVEPESECTLVAGNKDAKFVFVFVRVDSSSIPCDVPRTWAASGAEAESQLQQYKSAVQANAQKLSMLGSLANNFAVYSSDKILPSNSGKACPSIEDKASYVSHGWVMNGDGGAWAVKSQKAAWYCMHDYVLPSGTGTKRGFPSGDTLFAHEQLGHVFGMLIDEYDTGQPLSTVTTSWMPNYNCSSASTCDKWKSIQGGCIAECCTTHGGTVLYRGSENSIMRSDYLSGNDFTPLHLHVIRTMIEKFPYGQQSLTDLQNL